MGVITVTTQVPGVGIVKQIIIDHGGEIFGPGNLIDGTSIPDTLPMNSK